MGEKSSSEGNNSTAPTTSHAFPASIGFPHSVNPMFQSSSPFVQSPSVFSNVPHYDGNFFPLHHPISSYMHMLSSPPPLPQNFQGSNSSGQVHSPASITGTTSDSGKNKRIARDEAVATSACSPRKVKSLAHKKRKIPLELEAAKVGPTRWWTSAHDDVLIPFFANLAKSGLKPDNNFKQHAFAMAAAEVNNQFGTSFQAKSVVNHMKTIRSWFQDMQAARNISGAGWDEETQTIMLDPESFDTWNEDKNKSKLKDYINKPLKHYENLAIICGDDQARGNFAKAAMEKFGGQEPINLAGDDDEDVSIHMSQKSPHSVNLADEDNQSENNNVRSTSKDKQKKIPSARGRGRKAPYQQEIMQQMVEEVKHFSHSLNLINLHWTEKLSKAIFKHKDTYTIEFFELFYDHIFEDETKARHFIGKSDFGQRTLLENFKKMQDGGS
ncbi:uncharacterized protein LOC109828134 [Asparagus officinalis]|uniref:uncharacterized protein LOC109828134 n=1 Tax=Asparagus officinalis TaxID=4686 RepID=UPI00098DE92B|nr:uncharacterized protein LOC109828134 [Asparagus officinalis]